VEIFFQGDRFWTHTRHRCIAASCSLFDQLVGAAEQHERERGAERFGGLEVDHQLDFSRLLKWQIYGFLTLKYSSGVDVRL
jgi:hypothetical protein